MALATADFKYIRDLVRARSAIVLDDNKGYLVETRLMPLVRQEKFASIGELVEGLRKQSFNGLHQMVVEAMTTNETSFFRDQHPFDALKRELVPELMKKQASARKLNIWCCACSSGQEPYSVAMLLREHFPRLAGWDLTLLATDLSTEILARAREGRYGKLEVNRGLPVRLLVKYFKNEGLTWQIKEDIRRMVDYRMMNLIEAWPLLPTMDIIFMRNVLIYFDIETKKEILAKVRRVLKPDGYLFLGTAETTLNLDEAFKRVVNGKAICYRLQS